MNILELLKLGSIGLLFIFPFLAYKLLSDEQKLKYPRRKMLTPIYIYMGFTIIFGSASLFLEYMKYQAPKHTTSNQPILQNPPEHSIYTTIENEIKRLTNEHNRILSKLHNSFLEAERQSTFQANIETFKRQYLLQATRFSDAIKQENSDFSKNIQALKTLLPQ
jgi:hypothetical protein